MTDFARVKTDNRSFDRLAHRSVEYKVGGIVFSIALFHVMNYSQNIVRGKVHSHTTLELSLIEEGAIEYYTKERKISLKQGDVFFMPPGKIHGWRVLHHPFSITGFQLAMSTTTDERNFMEYFQEKARGKGYRLSDFNIFGEVLGGIRHEFESQTPYFMDRIDCLIRELLIAFMREASLHLEEDPAEHHGHDPNVLRVWVIKDFIRANLSTPLTLADVADHLNMSTRQLNRIYTEQEGTALGTYILDTKIAAAKDALTATERPVTDIAMHIGFPDVNYFCRLFKKKTGRSPSGYRQECRKIRVQ